MALANTAYDQATGEAGEDTYCEMLGRSGHDQETNDYNESTENEFYVGKQEAPVYATVDRCTKVIPS